MIKFAPQLINLFATLILLLAFAMISQRRIVSLINLFMMQGLALVVTSFLLGSWGAGLSEGGVHVYRVSGQRREAWESRVWPA